MTFPYSEQNALSRRRLEMLVGGLSDEDLARSTDYGWTVAALLAQASGGVSSEERQVLDKLALATELDRDSVDGALREVTRALAD